MFRQCVKDKVVDSRAANQQIIPSGREEDDEDEDEDKKYGELLEGFSKKERKSILKKISRMDGHEGGGDTERHKLDRHKKKSKKRNRVSDSESGREERRKGKRMKSSRKKHHRHRDDISEVKEREEN